MDLDYREAQPIAPFRLFTKESLTRIERQIQEEKNRCQQAENKEDDDDRGEEKPRPDPDLEAGKTLPARYGEFPPDLYGKPIEDIDDYYHNKYTFMVVAKDKTIFRFSALKAMFVISPFNPLRKTTIFILTHPFFGLCVMLVILVNCVFMAINQDVPYTEEVFTAIYTMEGAIKIFSRGFILTPFTYLRDAWNWLDFVVVALAYITMAIDLGNLAALRTFRVLRALKTVAVVPGLKTIVGALMEAVRRLRDVMILTVFVLSIFALVGLQIYQGALKYKCIKVHPDPFWWTHNATEDDKMEYYLNETNWWMISPSNAQVCGQAADAGKCPENYTCVGVGRNPNYGYTNFDNFGWAMLCAFRLMTQDYWENLYQLIIRAMGPWHMCFFVLVILLGSFYLVNLILAIVAMSYDEQHKQDQEDMEEEEEANNALAEERAAAEKALLREELGRSPSAFSGQIFAGREAASLIELEQQVRRVSIINKQGIKESLSLPPSPHNLRRSSQFSWGGGRKKIRHPSPRLGESDAVPLFPFPGLDNLDLPWIDSSNAATPTSEDLCNWSNTHGYVNQRRRLSSTSHSSRMSMLESRFGMDRRRNSAASQRSHGHMRNPHGFYNRHIESTHFAFPRPRGHPLVPEVRLDRTRLDDNESSSDGSECDTKSKLFADNPFIYRTPSATTVDHRDVMVLQDIFNTVAMGKKRRSFEGMSKKDYIKMKLQVLIDTCECPSWWHKFAHIVELIILDAFVDLFITLCIVINTIFMAMDHAGMSAQLAHTLSVGNYVFTAIFTLEAVLKIIALGPVLYLKDKWNCFDVVIVFLSLVELGLSTVKGLSILRSFRLLRVFKLAKSWPTLNLLIGIIGRTMGALGNLCFVLLIIVFIFAVMGMQLFGGNYTLKWFPEVPRWNFTDFLHSFMIVFRVLCGEWIESMWDCIHCSGYICVPFFLLTMIIGNLVVLNLFLALLLSSFGAENLQQSQDDGETNKLQEAVDRINRFTQYVKSHVLYCIKVKICKRHVPIDEFDPTITRTDLTSKEYLDGGLPMRNGKVREADLSPEGDDDVTHKDLRILTLRLVKGTSKAHVGYSPVSPYEPNDEDCEVCQGSTRPASCGSCSTIKISKVSSRDSKLSSSESESTKSGSEVSIISESRYSYSRDDTESLNKPIDSEGLEISEVNVIFVREPDECCPRCCVKRLPCIDQFAATKCGRVWWSMRCYMYKLVEHKYFETFIIFCIVASSLALAIEDVYLPERPTLKLVLMYMDKVFTVIFVVEMLIKWSAYGFKKYFTDAWCWLDFVIVAISLIMLGAEGAGLANMGAFRALRTLRALRPLRAVSRWEGMKVVVNALIQAIPSICNVLLVCLVFWLIFSIMGVQMFGGRFYACVDSEGNTVNASLVPNMTVCNLLKESHNFSWERPDVNFDDALTAYLALLQIATFKGWVQIMEDAIDSQSTATFKGWIDIMNHAIDSREIGQQPMREVRVYLYLYFVFFIIFGSFFTLNLFIGVIIDNFNMQKKKIRGSLEMFMTEDQKKYYNAMKKLGSKQPSKPIPKPKLKCQLFFFKLTTNQKFDIGIMAVILLNMLTMSLEHHGQSETFSSVLMYINEVFIVIFTLECIMKLLGLRWYYFKAPWNVFDFVVVVLSILGLAMSDLIEDYFVSPTLLRVVRVFRVGRVLRLVKSAKGIRTLLFSLAVSLPALFNIGLLLFLVMFIYAIFGMNFFLHVKHTAGLDDMFNFETFGRSMILLFQISTSAGWDGVLAGLMNDSPPGCDQTPTANSQHGDCGNSGMAIPYLVSYLVISFLVVINMYIAVILENFSQATEDVQQGLTQDDFDMYYEIWEKYDEKATQYIPLSKLSEFVAELEEPLCIPQPNYMKLVVLDITICEGDRVHCVDILDALTKNFLGTAGDPVELGDIKKGPKRKNYVPISSLMRRQREHLCARIVQRAWRRHKERKARGGGGVPQQTIITIDDADSGSSGAGGVGGVKSVDGATTTKVVLEDIKEAPDCEEEEEETSAAPVGPRPAQRLAPDSANAETLPPAALPMEGPDPNLNPDDSKTVELFPESGVVA